MDTTEFRLMMDHLANLTAIHHDLQQSVFGGQANEEHADRCSKALITLEEMICDIVETLQKHRGQVA